MGPIRPVPSDPLPPCQSPSDRVWPPQQLSFQREITSEQDPEAHVENVQLQCETTSVHVSGSVLATFVQEWAPKGVLVGDHVSTISLAPSEVLTIEMRRTQHTLLEESREVASTVEQATEKLDSGKEAITTANTSARTANLGVSANGGVQLNWIVASPGYTNSETINQR